MAADLVKTILDAESLASNQIDDAKDEGQRLIEFTKNHAAAYSDKLLREAEEKAKDIIEKAKLDFDGESKKTEKVAQLYIRKLISETEKKYPEAIDTVIACILNG